MFLRIDRLQIELPQPKDASPESAAAVQELLGGRFGEMSTLMNYMYQSFNFRGRDQLKPFYDLIANIAAEQLGHIELVAATINLLLTGSTKPRDPAGAPRRQSQHPPLHRRRADGALRRLDGGFVARRLRLLQRQPEAGPAAQLLPGVRGPYPENPRL